MACSQLPRNIRNGGLYGEEPGDVYQPVEGSTVRYYCYNEGYSLLGDHVRMCQANGIWSGEQPSCGKLWLKVGQTKFSFLL